VPLFAHILNLLAPRQYSNAAAEPLYQEGLGLEGQVLGLDLAGQVLVNITVVKLIT